MVATGFPCEADSPHCKKIIRITETFSNNSALMNLTTKLAVMAACVIPGMAIGAGLGFWLIKIPTTGVWGKVPEIHAIFRSAIGLVAGGSLGVGIARIYISMQDDDLLR